MSDDIKAPETPAPINPRVEELHASANRLSAALGEKPQNAPLVRGLARKFQMAWNAAHRAKGQQKLPENGELGRVSHLALRSVLTARK